MPIRTDGADRDDQPAVARRSDHRADPLHQRHHRRRPRARRSRAPRSPPTWTRWRSLAVDPRRHPRPRPAAVPRARAGAGRARARCASAAGSCTPAGRCRPATPPPAATLYFGVPTVWSRWSRTRRARGPCARRACWSPARRRCRRRSSPACTRSPATAPVERYGMTETLITVSARARRSARGRATSAPRCRAWRPAWRPRTRRGRRRAPGPRRDALRWIRTPGASHSESFTADGWFRTGDAATIDDDWRAPDPRPDEGDLIKSGGFRIGAGEVEDALLTHPAVHEAAVLGRPARRTWARRSSRS